MRNILRGAVGGIIVGFIVGNYFPANPYSSYDTEIRSVAITSKLIYGVCPNENGVLTLRDAYVSSVGNVIEKSYILKNFDEIFDNTCRKSNVTNAIVSSEK